MFLKGLGAGAWSVKPLLEGDETSEQRMGPALPEVHPAPVEWISFAVLLGY